MTINIQPLAVKSATKIVVNETALVPGENPSLRVNVTLFDSSDTKLDQRDVTLSGANYKKWRTGTDDDLIPCICQVLGAKQANPVVAEKPALVEEAPKASK
jgi:hypothetical protein